MSGRSFRSRNPYIFLSSELRRNPQHLGLGARALREGGASVRSPLHQPGTIAWHDPTSLRLPRLQRRDTCAAKRATATALCVHQAPRRHYSCRGRSARIRHASGARLERLGSLMPTRCLTGHIREGVHYSPHPPHPLSHTAVPLARERGWEGRRRAFPMLMSAARAHARGSSAARLVSCSIRRRRHSPS